MKLHIKLPHHIASQTFLWICCGLIVLGGFNTVKELVRLSHLRAENPFVFGGEKFEGIKGLVKGQKYVGYLTDKDLNIDKNIAEFLHAQFALVPSVLDLNDPNHRFLIINCDDPRRALALVESYKAKPLKRNNLGMIIAVREDL